MHTIALDHLEVDGVEVPLVVAELNVSERSHDEPEAWEIIVTAPREVHLEPGSSRIEATSTEGTVYRAEGLVGDPHPQPTGDERLEITGMGPLEAA